MDREDLINAYFEGQLDEGQRQQFDKLMSEDVEFAKELTFRKNLAQAIKIEERSRLKSKLRTFEGEQNVSRKSFGIRRWISAAAAILIVGIAAIWWHNRTSPERLYSSYFETFPNIVQPLVRGEGTDNINSAAFLSYDQGDYQKSAMLFADASDAIGLFYGALSEMELGDHQKALKLFERIDVSTAELGPYMLWYKSLNLLKLGRRAEAAAILSKLEKENDFELADKVSSLKNELVP
jgi:tetratricopeptide (TPR) repeat protein